MGGEDTFSSPTPFFLSILTESFRMLDCYRIDGYCVNKPYRAKLNGQVLKNKKGETLKFNSLLAAMSYAQRVSEKKSTK